MSRSMSHWVDGPRTILPRVPSVSVVDRERRRLESPFGPTRQRAGPVSSACDPSRPTLSARHQAGGAGLSGVAPRRWGSAAHRLGVYPNCIWLGLGLCSIDFGGAECS